MHIIIDLLERRNIFEAQMTKIALKVIEDSLKSFFFNKLKTYSWVQGGIGEITTQQHS